MSSHSLVWPLVTFTLSDFFPCYRVEARNLDTKMTLSEISIHIPFREQEILNATSKDLIRPHVSGFDISNYCDTLTNTFRYPHLELHVRAECDTFVERTNEPRLSYSTGNRGYLRNTNGTPLCVGRLVLEPRTRDYC